MKNRQMIVLVIGFFWLSSLASESCIGNAHACTNFKIQNDQAVFLGNSEDQALGPFVQISDTFITFVPKGHTWYDGSELTYGAVVVGYGNDTGNSWVQGGMNEKGLAFDLTSVPYTEPNLHNEKPQYLVPEIFCCETISQVIEYKKTHGVYQQEGRVQSFYVDKSGESVAFSIGEDGEFNFVRNNRDFQLATNYYVDDPSRGNPNSDAIRRFLAAELLLNSVVRNDNLSIESITLVLDATHFEGPSVNTLYSNIFDVTNGDIYIYFFHQFSQVVKLNLQEELAKGFHAYRISDLFTQGTVDSAFHEYNEYPFIVRGFPSDLVLLFAAMTLDVLLVFASVFALSKKVLYRKSESKTPLLKPNLVNATTSKGLRLQIIISVAVIWSFLSFPMIYWNRKGEWWPFFDDIPILQWPLQSFYEFHNLFLLMGLLGVALTAFLLSSFTNRGEAIQLLKTGMNLRKETRWRNIAILASPALIGLFYLFLERLDAIPKVDWIMFAVMYPSIVATVIMLAPYSKRNSIKEQDLGQDKTRTNLLKAGILLIIAWGLSFLPLLLTRTLDHMYVLLLGCLALSIMIRTLIDPPFLGRPSKIART